VSYRKHNYRSLNFSGARTSLKDSEKKIPHQNEAQSTRLSLKMGFYNIGSPTHNIQENCKMTLPRSKFKSHKLITIKEDIHKPTKNTTLENNERFD
jgi:hypothetical protein